MVNPFLHAALHLHLVHPVNVVGCGFIIRRFGNDCIQFLVIVMHHFIHVVAVDFEPGKELVVEHIVFFKGISYAVDESGMGVFVVRIDFAAALVNHHEHGFDARGGLSTEAHRSGGRDGEHCDISAPDTAHFLVQIFV